MCLDEAPTSNKVRAFISSVARANLAALGILAAHSGVT
jgi:hypothetical protein